MIRLYIRLYQACTIRVCTILQVELKIIDAAYFHTLFRLRELCYCVICWNIPARP